MANDLAVKLKLLEPSDSQRVKNILKRYALPTTFKITDVDAFYAHFSLDKKADDSKIKFILANGLGKNVIRNDINEEIVKDLLREYSN